jgi:electron transfer flavoprotein beta subunit
MNLLTCIKRVPFTGGKINLTADGQDIETKHLGFTISPHEECAVEEAVRLSETQGATTTVLTLGPAAAEEQLRDALAMGIENAILLETDGREWDAVATAQAIAAAVRAGNYDALFFGNEAADTGDYQVGARVAHLLDWPCVVGIKALEIKDGKATAKREVPGGWEIYETQLPAVFTIKEGINLPRYPPLMGRLKAKKKTIQKIQPQGQAGGLSKVALKLPQGREKQVEILGKGPEAAPRVVAILQKLGLL